jgi:hypothetical protein
LCAIKGSSLTLLALVPTDITDSNVVDDGGIEMIRTHLQALSLQQIPSTHAFKTVTD